MSTSSSSHSGWAPSLTPWPSIVRLIVLYMGRKHFNNLLGGVNEGEEPLIFEERFIEKSFDEAALEIDEEAWKVKIFIRQIL